jgi:hypothetical protein
MSPASNALLLVPANVLLKAARTSSGTLKFMVAIPSPPREIEY